MSLHSAKIYLDYASTTPLDPEVKKAMASYFDDRYGNPSSTHSFGQEVRVAIDKARETVADFLGCNFVEVYFTSGATEANNLAIKGVTECLSIFSHNGGKIWTNGQVQKLRLITSKIEHKSVLRPIESLEKAELAETTYLPVNKDGAVNASNLKNLIKENTILISAMYVNNETGVIQPVEEIGEIIKEWKSGNKSKLGLQYPLFHIDAAQAAGHLPLDVRELGCDLLSLSSHKIYGPKGVGALYVREGTPITSLIEGGGQEMGLRSGTENTAGIVGLGRAIELLCPLISKQIQNSKFKTRYKILRARAPGLVPGRQDTEYSLTSGPRQADKIEELRGCLENGILNNIKNTSVNGGSGPRAPHISNILFKGVEAESLIIALDSEGVAVSSGSACQAKAIEPSHVLLAMGFSKKDAASSVRFSLGKYTTKEEIDTVLKILPDLVKKLS